MCLSTFLFRSRLMDIILFLSISILFPFVLPSPFSSLSLMCFETYSLRRVFLRSFTCLLCCSVSVGSDSMSLLKMVHYLTIRSSAGKGFLWLFSMTWPNDVISESIFCFLFYETPFQFIRFDFIL